MKDIRKALRALLVADPTVNSLSGGRIYPVQLPQGVRASSVVYHRVTGLIDYQMNGGSGLAENLFQIDSVAITNDDATLLANAVHDCLTGHRGEVFFGSSSPQDSIMIHGIFQVNDRDVFDNVTQMMAAQRDFEIWFWE